MKTKIIGTIGPSCWHIGTARKMYKAGLNIARINASFADKSELSRVKEVYHKVSPQITMMVDTVGFKIRLDKNNIEKTVKKGERVLFSSHPIKDNVLGLDYQALEKDINIGDRMLIDDGLAQLRVIEKTADYITAKALIPCTIKKGKTLSLPDTKLSFTDAISEKDRINIQNAIDLNYDFLNISFVRNIEDLRAIKQFIGTAKISLVAKIENKEGVQNIDEILPYVDVLMIPRGDLSLETPFENIPIIQKEMSIKAAQYGKPVIYASQILDSMKTNRFPLKAEISDLGNAVYDRSDAILLAQETAIGAYPVTTVQTARKITDKVEQSFALDPLFSDELVMEVATKTAKNPKTKEYLDKAMQMTYQVANNYNFNCAYGLDAYQSMAEFWYEFEPLVYLSKLRKNISLSFESPDVRAVRQVGILYGVNSVSY